MCPCSGTAANFERDDVAYATSSLPAVTIHIPISV
jgi:hypothetical protein